MSHQFQCMVSILYTRCCLKQYIVKAKTLRHENSHSFRLLIHAYEAYTNFQRLLKWLATDSYPY